MGGNDDNKDTDTTETSYGDDFMDVCGTYGKRLVQ